MRTLFNTLVTAALLTSSCASDAGDNTSNGEENSCSACTCLDDIQCLTRLQYVFSSLDTISQTEALKTMMSKERTDLCYIGDIEAANCNEVLLSTFLSGTNPSRLSKLMGVCSDTLQGHFETLVAKGFLSTSSDCDHSLNVEPVDTNSMDASSFATDDGKTEASTTTLVSESTQKISSSNSVSFMTIILGGSAALVAVGYAFHRKARQVENRYDFVPL